MRHCSSGHSSRSWSCPVCRSRSAVASYSGVV
jgi:hypothetical protein